MLGSKVIKWPRCTNCIFLGKHHHLQKIDRAAACYYYNLGVCVCLEGLIFSAIILAERVIEFKENYIDLDFLSNKNLPSILKKNLQLLLLVMLIFLRNSINGLQEQFFLLKVCSFMIKSIKMIICAIKQVKLHFTQKLCQITSSKNSKWRHIILRGK